MTNDGAAQFRAAGVALKDADKATRREVSAAFRRAAGPLGRTVLVSAGAQLPKHGGLAARIAAGKVSVTTSFSGRNPGVALSFRAPGVSGKTMNLRAIDDGTVRHPLFGNRKVWRETKVRPGAFRLPFYAGREPVGREVVKALDVVAQEIAARTNRGA